MGLAQTLSAEMGRIASVVLEWAQAARAREALVPAELPRMASFL